LNEYGDIINPERRIKIRATPVEESKAAQKTTNPLIDGDNLNCRIGRQNLLASYHTPNLSHLEDAREEFLQMRNPETEETVAEEIDEEQVAYNTYLAMARSYDLTKAQRLDFIRCPGKDALGREVIVIIGQHLDMEKCSYDMALLYIIKKIDRLVCEDYVIVFVNSETNWDNVPSLGWQQHTFSIFNQHFCHNLANLYIIHPTLWTKTSLMLMRPFANVSFWDKIVYIDRVLDIYKTFDFHLLNLPDFVFEYENITFEALATKIQSEIKLAIGPGDNDL